MFYSRQLLARKAPLGQIWRAATTHMKINRRKLNKLDIIKICEEILNPSVPMALRLSGILMGGVVIVYEQKVKLLHDDVNRFLIEINNAWKVKASPDSTLLPRGKSQAKKEAVTLPDNQDVDFGDTEQSLNYSNTAAMGFQETNYFAMRLDSIDEAFINGDARDGDRSEHFHQAKPEDITLCEPFDPYQANATMYNHYERFDVEGDDAMQFNFTSGEPTHIPSTYIPSPPPQPEPQRGGDDQASTNFLVSKLANLYTLHAADEIHDENLEPWGDQKDEREEVRQLQRSSITSTVKIANLMELPPTVLMDNLFHKYRVVYYPPPLMELLRKSTLPLRDSLPGRTSPPPPPEASEFPLLEQQNYLNPMDTHFEDFLRGFGSQSLNMPEGLRYAANDISTELLASMKGGVGETSTHFMATPRNSGGDISSIPSTGSGHGISSNNSKVNAGRLRPYSPSRQRSGNLRPVAEENSLHYIYPNYPTTNIDPNFILASVDENNGLTPDQELLVETGPTQTQLPVITQPVDHITDSIKMQLKAHFDTPGAPQVESLNNLALGMTRKGAAQLFFQTCVLATRDALRVEQKVPYGQILISRGEKM
ncbi:sister chromatid cohesion 1 protein 1 [Morus notabilis]|uniref:sister chromatid cohesion 1 protein 1 n=1 Tax=Morus notabilis TaxID=981085 RepID=UPI000CED66C8|nr:sister chromatid cohesion 1 protein 1 [Morus notabilis]